MVRDELKSLNNSTSKIKGPSTKYMSMRMKFLQKQREKSVDSDWKSNWIKNPNLSASYNSNAFTTSLNNGAQVNKFVQKHNKSEQISESKDNWNKYSWCWLQLQKRRHLHPKSFEQYSAKKYEKSSGLQISFNLLKILKTSNEGPN